MLIEINGFKIGTSHNFNNLCSNHYVTLKFILRVRILIFFDKKTHAIVIDAVKTISHY